MTVHFSRLSITNGQPLLAMRARTYSVPGLLLGYAVQAARRLWSLA